jgi:hypothetical protein
MAWWRKLLGRPRQVVFAEAGVASASVVAGNATAATGMRGPFSPRPSQSVEDQIQELGLLVNRLREEVIQEPQERERAIAADREARRRSCGPWPTGWRPWPTTFATSSRS